MAIIINQLTYTILRYRCFTSEQTQRFYSPKLMETINLAMICEYEEVKKVPFYVKEQ